MLCYHVHVLFSIKRRALFYLMPRLYLVSDQIFKKTKKTPMQKGGKGIVRATVGHYVL